MLFCTNLFIFLQSMFQYNQCISPPSHCATSPMILSA